MSAKKKRNPIYAELPEELTGLHWVQDKQNEDGTQQSFVSAFLDHALPSSRQNEKEKDMKRRYVSLTAKTIRKRKNDKKKKKSLSAAEKRGLDIFKLNPKEIKYDLYMPLHELWKDYMRDLLCLEKVTPSNCGETQRKFIKGDLHGSLIVVSMSGCPSLIGVSGLVLQETKNTFKVVSKGDKLKTIPKKGSVLNITLDDYTFTIYGSNFLFRASDRATRSFKMRHIMDLNL